MTRKESIPPRQAREPGSGELLEEKQRMIAEAVASLFTVKGFHGTSMREIAKAVGMSIGNLYHYISSKDDVLYLVYRALYRKWEERSGVPGAETIKDPVERLKALMTTMLRITYHDKELTQMTLRESKFLKKSALKKVLSTESDYIERFVETLDEGIRKGIFKPLDTKIIGNFIAYNMFFFALRSWYFRRAVSFEEVEKAIIDFTLDALLAHPRRSKAGTRPARKRSSAGRKGS